MNIIGIFGAGGLGREVMPLMKEATFFPEIIDDNTQIFFVETDPKEKVVNNVKVLNYHEFVTYDANKKYFSVAIGSSTARSEIATRLTDDGCIPISIKARNSVIYENSIISHGAHLCDNTIITSNCRIGEFFQANIFSYVAHDVQIGNFVTFAPRVSCNGNVIVEDFAYIGTRRSY